MLKFYTVILVLFVSSSALSQKKIEKIFDATALEKITINGDGMYKITVRALPVSQVTLKGSIEGETFENLLITEHKKLNELAFGIVYAPFFKQENDKLAAHKVLSVEIELTVPEEMKVVVSSNLASFIGSGKYKNLHVELQQGSCSVTNFLGNGAFATLAGDIFIETNSQVSGTAMSQFGTANNQLNKYQTNQISAESKHGNIHLLQTEY